MYLRWVLQVDSWMMPGRITHDGQRRIRVWVCLVPAYEIGRRRTVIGARYIYRVRTSVQTVRSECKINSSTACNCRTPSSTARHSTILQDCECNCGAHSLIGGGERTSLRSEVGIPHVTSMWRGSTRLQAGTAQDIKNRTGNRVLLGMS
jgi:hypothetical protein